MHSPSVIEKRHLRSIPSWNLLAPDCTSEVVQSRLAAAHVAILGCGGLGGFVLDTLVRMGIGHLTLVDPDIFTPSNQNRQLLCTTKTLGQPKARVAAAYAKRIHPRIQSNVFICRANQQTLPVLLQNCSVAVDALDSLPDKRTLVAVAASLKVPVVHGAVAGLLGHATTILPGDTTLNTLYPQHLTVEELQQSMGVASGLPAIIANIQANEVLKLLLDRNDLVLHNKLFLCDLATPLMHIVDIAAP